MGRPIRKGWFSSYYGPATVNLNVETTAGAEVVVSQPGTSTYSVGDDVHVRLVDGPVTLAAGLCKLQHNTKFVRKLDQFNAYYFDGTSALWNNGDGVIVGTFVPAPTPREDTEPGAPVVVTPPPVVPPAVVPATLGAIVVDESTAANDPGTITSIAVTDGGANYVTAPTVTITGTNTTPAAATATVVGGVVTAIVITNAGTGYGAADVAASLS